MINIAFTEEEKKALNHERYHHPHPHGQRKMEAWWLKSQGLSHAQICRLADMSPNTLRRYRRDDQAGGFDTLKEVNFYQPQSQLAAHRETLEDYFRDHPPATIKEAAAQIKEWIGIERQETPGRAFLKSLGLQRRQVGRLPAQADPDEQEKFKADPLAPRLAEAQAG
jgi:transposase